MKSKILTILLLSFISYSGNAQFGKIIQKAKEEVVNKTKDKTVSAETSSGQGIAGKVSPVTIDPATLKIEREADELLRQLKVVYDDKDKMHQASQKEVENLYLKFSSKVNTLKNYYRDTSKELPRLQRRKNKVQNKNGPTLRIIC